MPIPPIAGGPERSFVRSLGPRAGDPVIAHRRIGPIAGSP
jgi:hypothetical protein